MFLTDRQIFIHIFLHGHFLDIEYSHYIICMNRYVTSEMKIHFYPSFSSNLPPLTFHICPFSNLSVSARLQDVINT